MRRKALTYLYEWSQRTDRKPLVLRGARQVGKSTLVRLFSSESKLKLIEINLEKQVDFRACFQSKDVRKIINLLELKLGKKITPGKTLLFLDEIQAAPEVLAVLRYFYEDMPELAVIAAGSLLEFVLEQHNFSMPVGRIEYLHLGPMTFKEFLAGIGRDSLSNFLSEFTLCDDFPEVIHDELKKLYRIFLATGGMPEAIRTYKNSGKMLDVERVKQGILSTYADDFNKYLGRVNQQKLHKTFQALPGLIGQKMKYTHVDKDAKSADIKNALHLLHLAKVYYPVQHSSASGIPLKSQVNAKIHKALFLDVGLMNKACGLTYQDFEFSDELRLINSGAVSEQFIGQHLLYQGETWEDPELFYWCREKAQSSAEVDYLTTLGSTVIPIEVKSGKTGSLKSLHAFLAEKNLSLALRFNLDRPSYCDTIFHYKNESHSMQLLSLPLYMVEESKRLLKEAMWC